MIKKCPRVHLFDSSLLKFQFNHCAVFSPQQWVLVQFLCDPSHFGAHVTHEEECDGGDAH